MATANLRVPPSVDGEDGSGLGGGRPQRRRRVDDGDGDDNKRGEALTVAPYLYRTYTLVARACL